MSIFVVLVAGVAAGCGHSNKPATAAKTAVATGNLPPIKGLQIGVAGLTYNVTGVRLLDFDDPASKPYLVNLPRPGTGDGYLGVFLRVYNPTAKPMASAAGFLLEPSKNPNLIEQYQASESRFTFEASSMVPAGGVIPKPGSDGKYPGGVLIYAVTNAHTAAQPFDLVIHTAEGGIAKLRLPAVKQIKGVSSHD
jgi:hypothetical protein